MYVAKQEVVLARSGFMAKKRSKWLGLAVLGAMVIYLGAYAGLLGRWVPIGWFREIPEVTQLNPVVASKMGELKSQSKRIGIHVLITSDFRSSEEQDALYRKGRSDDGSIVTQVKGEQSYHNYGLAIDFALRTPNGKVIWDMKYDGNRNGKSDWMEVVSLAKRLGFSWGGDWASFPDYPHLQMDFGYSIRELQWGWRPPVQKG
jgi:peptidoglycan L-alanyl-D-glutamate endopeptidase CwlK